MDVGRRRVLRAACATACVGLAGCSGGMEKGATVAAERTSEMPGDDATVVAFADLAPPEQEVLREAVESGPYQTCDEVPEAVRTFRKRLGGQESYLRYRDDHYALYVQTLDQVFASTARSPGAPDCGLL